MANYKLSYTAEEVNELLKKVSNGDEAIKLDEYGLSMVSLILSGGGKTRVSGTGNFWRQVNAKQENCILMAQSQGYAYYMRLSCIRKSDEGEIVMVATQFFDVMSGAAMVIANIVF